ncbi:hypothetical protein ACO1PF_00640 [Alkalibacterium sp. f15]|uniref:hypothetical protein n=1 Tax=Alkalibacterium sp. f15 TaxID=3414029 RepID=UPI003BF926D3
MGDRTVIEIIRALYDLANAKNVVESETGEHISFEDYQDMIADDLSELANVLGIDLDKE